MKIHHISDTHGFHKDIKIDESVDLIIHSGDCSNPRDLIQSEMEIRNFIEWYGSFKIPCIFVAGNHDLALERRKVTPGDFAKAGIIYLENQSTIFNGLKIFGSPISPSFGEGWAYNMARHKTHMLWKTIPEDTDIIITHGPPKGILDLSYNREHVLEFCGDAALLKRINNLKQLKAVMFGHIHSVKDIINNGVLLRDNVLYSNGTCVMDGEFDLGIVNHGNTFEYINDKIKIYEL